MTKLLQPLNYNPSYSFSSVIATIKQLTFDNAAKDTLDINHMRNFDIILGI